jgi:hypothetical protein
MIGKRMSPRLAWAPKISWAKGTPIASVFFTEQNRAAIKSSRDNFTSDETPRTNSEIVVNKITTEPNTWSVRPIPYFSQTRPSTESQKAV